jgi:hypothetical protein
MFCFCFKINSSIVVMAHGFMSFFCYKYQSKNKDVIFLPHGCQMVWSYSDNHHGEGVYGGARAILKQEI